MVIITFFFKDYLLLQFGESSHLTSRQRFFLKAKDLTKVNLDLGIVECNTVKSSTKRQREAERNFQFLPSFRCLIRFESPQRDQLQSAKYGISTAGFQREAFDLWSRRVSIWMRSKRQLTPAVPPLISHRGCPNAVGTLRFLPNLTKTDWAPF